MGGILFSVGVIFAYQAWANDYYHAPWWTTVAFYEHGNCAVAMNQCSSQTMLLPTRSWNEWNSLLNSAPSCLNVSLADPCSYCGVGCSGGGDGSGSDGT